VHLEKFRQALRIGGHGGIYPQNGQFLCFRVLVTSGYVISHSPAPRQR
jgi:hypothetical protein